MQSPNPVAYGGVAADLKACQTSFDPPKLPHGWFPGEFAIVYSVQTVHFAARAIDTPFSVVGDTVTLPLTGRRDGRVEDANS